MVEPVRATVLGLIAVGFILCLVGIVTPFWGMGLLTQVDKEKGVVEDLVNNWDSPNFVRASIWNSHSWWPEVSATGTQLKPTGNLAEAKVIAVFALISGIASVIVHAIYTFRSTLNFSKIWCVASSCLQISSGMSSGIVCCIMAGCLTNKMAANPLFRLGDSFIVTVIGAILFTVCGLFTLFHFVYSVKELALDRKLLLLYPEMQATDAPQYAGGGVGDAGDYGGYGAGDVGGMPGEPFPTSTTIAGHLQSPSQEFSA